MDFHIADYFLVFTVCEEVFYYVGVLDSLSLADILAGAYFSQQENNRFRIQLLSQ